MNGLLGFSLHSILNVDLNWIIFIHFILATIFIGVIISVRRPVGVAFAWMFIVVTFPVFGIGLYILIGDRPVGRKLTRKIIRMQREYTRITENMRKQFASERQLLPLEGRALSILAEAKNGAPVVSGNKIELFTNSLEILQHFIDDIDGAKKSLHLEF